MPEYNCANTWNVWLCFWTLWSSPAVLLCILSNYINLQHDKMNNTRNKFYLTNLDLKRTFYDVFTVHYMKDKQNPHNTWLTNANLLLKSSALLMSGSHYAHQHTNTPTSGHTHNAQPTHTWTWPVALATCIHFDDDPKIGLKKNLSRNTFLTV